jgi:hypothetical protein
MALASEGVRNENILLCGSGIVGVRHERLAVMEGVTGLRFEVGPIEARIYEGVSYSGHHQVPMQLRASYSRDTKQATLVHELAHRLIGDLVPKGTEDHPIIFLFVYDAWTELWGKQFADEQVLVESRRRGLYDYATAWRDVLALSREERSKRLHEFIDAHRGS